MYNIHQIEELSLKLQEYTDADNSETGEAFMSVVNACKYIAFFTDEFAENCVRELEDMLKWYQENFTWDEREITYTQKVKELVYKDDV